MNESSFIEYVILGGIALFLIRQLYNVLGSSPDTSQNNTIDKNEKDDVSKTSAKIINLSETLAASFAEEQTKKSQNNDSITSCISEQDEDFDVDDFKIGAEKAFKMILSAYAKENEQALQKLLDDSVFEQFSSAIAQRQIADRVMKIDIIGILSSDIVDANVSKGKANITIKFISEQINTTEDANTKEIIDGDPSHINTIHDVWTFARDISSNNPNWVLVATSSPNESE